MKKKQKPYWEMNTEELARATAEFDKPFVIDTFSPPSAKDRARWERLRRKLGPPACRREVRVISASIDRGLLARADALAHRKGLTRAELIERGLRAALILAGGE